MSAIQQVLLGLSSAFTPPFDSVVLARTPWGYWKMDETPITGGSTSASDASGNARDGAYIGSPWSTAGGLFASSTGCPTFNGSTNYVTLPNFTLATNQKFSIVGFIKTNYAAATAKSILSADITGNRRWQLRIANGKVGFVTIMPSVTTTDSIATLSDNVAHMVAVVFDPTLAAGAGVVKIYVDGVLDNQSSTVITITAGTANPAIGSRSNQASQDNWTGNLDNMAFFDTALTAADITALWASRNQP